jgi:hypothetical protein
MFQREYFKNTYISFDPLPPIVSVYETYKYWLKGYLRIIPVKFVQCAPSGFGWYNVNLRTWNERHIANIKAHLEALTMLQKA